jgi:hypothetical protein
MVEEQPVRSREMMGIARVMDVRETCMGNL